MHWLVVLGLIAAVVAVALFLFTRRRRPRPRKDTFVLVGLSNAGKTALFHRLRHGAFVRSYASLKENEFKAALHSEVSDPAVSARAVRRPLTVIDLPGHEKQRFRFADYAPIAGGVVVVIDAAAFDKEHAAVADYLYDVLSAPAVNEHRNPVLIVCNKTDMPAVSPVANIRATLEREFEMIRKTRMASVDGQSGTAAYLGYEQRPFSFDDLVNDVAWVEASASKGDTEQVEIWMRELYPVPA